MSGARFWNGTSFSTTVVLDVVVVTLAADGTDQTASLQGQIDAVSNGTSSTQRRTILLPVASAGYRVDGKITLSGRSNLVVTSRPGGTFRSYTALDGIELGITNGDGTSNRQHWLINACAYLTISNLAVHGANDERDPGDSRFSAYKADRAFEHGFAVQGASDHILLENFTVTEVYGDGVYIGGTGSPNTNITVRNGVGTFTGRQLVGLVNAYDSLLEDLNFQWGARSGLDVEPNADTHYVHRLTVRRCTMGSKSYPFVVGGDAGDSLIHNEDIVLEDCVGLNASSSHPALLTRPSKNLTLRRHTDLRQRSISGIDLNGWIGTVLVEFCNISSGQSTPTSAGVYLHGGLTADVTIRGNTFNGAAGDAPGVGGADVLYIIETDSTPASVTHSGNVWNMGANNDGTLV